MKMFTIAFLSALLMTTACDKPQPQEAENIRKDIALTKAQSGICAMTNGFTFDFMKTLAAKERKDVNMFASPFSLQTVLAMTAQGAEGATAKEMYEGLRLSGFSKDEIADFFKTVIPALETVDNTTVMEVANSFWSKKSIVIKDDYAAKLKADYYAECRTLDFDGKAAAKAVNNWCGEKTHGMITKVVDEVPADQMAALINAIYFKGEWETPFSESANYEDKFTNFDGSSAKVTFMNRSTKMDVYTGEKAASITLPYGNGAYSMTVILPERNVSVDEILAGLDAESWRRYRNGGDRYQVEISLPKFDTEYTAEDLCKSALQEMGIKLAFTPAADFSGISDTDLCIDQVIHKAKVKVNEKGTEAAAVSYVGMKLTSAAAPMPFYEFKADRPFIYVISEVSTGAIIFLGVQKTF